MRRARALLVLAVIATTATAMPRQASAQSIWLTREGKHAVMLEFILPTEDDNADALTGALFVSGRNALSHSLTFVGQVPFARFSAPGRVFYNYTINGFVTADVNETMMGNVYLGIEGTPSTSRIFGEGGVRLPLASDRKPFAASMGAEADLRRLQAFTPNTVCIESAVNVRSLPDSKVAYRLRISPILEFDTDRSTSQILTNFSGQVGYQRPSVRVGGAISGRADFGNNGYSLLDRNLVQLEFHSDFLSGPLRPGIDVRVPLGTWSESAGTVVGANLTWVR
jgi:hypothetical protein